MLKYLVFVEIIQLDINEIERYIRRKIYERKFKYTYTHIQVIIYRFLTTLAPMCDNAQANSMQKQIRITNSNY